MGTSAARRISPTDRRRYPSASPSPPGRPTSSRAPQSRHGAGARRHPGGRAREDLWPLDRMRRRSRRVDAPRRHVSRAVSDVRHRRRRRARRRRGPDSGSAVPTARRSPSSATARRTSVPSTSPQPGRHPQAARRVRVREQPLRRVPRINLSTPVGAHRRPRCVVRMPGIAVDGQDVDEVISAVESALEQPDPATVRRCWR